VLCANTADVWVEIAFIDRVSVLV